jgi:hypothetical protein
VPPNSPPLSGDGRRRGGLWPPSSQSQDLPRKTAHHGSFLGDLTASTKVKLDLHREAVL